MSWHNGLNRSSMVSAISIALCQRGGKHQSCDTVQGLEDQKVKPASRFPLSKQQSENKYQIQLSASNLKANLDVYISF